MKKKIFCVAFCAAILICALPFAASADTGPKPSVNVEITGVEGEYYVTLISLQKSTGPASAWDGTEEHKNLYDLDPVIWEKFAYYEDSDGFYFLQQFSKCEGHDTYKWGYYPPQTFKVLIYIPASDTFIVSEVCERYAFDSYFHLEAEAGGLEAGACGATVAKNYDYTLEILSLLARILVTIALETVIAVPFMYREKKELLFIACTNILTQVTLNIWLNAENFYNGQGAFTAWYIFLELFVFVIEAVLYAFVLPRFEKKPKKRYVAVLYALTANVFSFVLGLFLAHIIPGMF